MNDVCRSDHRCLHQRSPLGVVACVHGSAVACEKCNALDIVLDGEEVQSCLAKPIGSADEFGMLAKKLLGCSLVEDRSIDELLEKWVFGECHLQDARRSAEHPF